MATQLTWEDIEAFVSAVCPRDKSQPTLVFYRALAREALGQIAEVAEAFETGWTNAAGGALTLTAAVCVLPIDCLQVNRVEWDGSDNGIDRTTEETLDYEEPGWRTATGDPTRFFVDGNQIVLNAIPTAPITGKLVVRGLGTLPDFSAWTEAVYSGGVNPANPVNPLSHLPVHLQMAPAYYILANLLADPEKRVEVERQAKYAALWTSSLQRIVDITGRRKREAFAY